MKTVGGCCLCFAKILEAVSDGGLFAKIQIRILAEFNANVLAERV